MPREQITHAPQKTAYYDPQSVELVEPEQLHVGWDPRGEAVQVGIDASLQQLDQLVEWARKAPDRGEPGHPHSRAMLWISVDRADVNRLIRVLRSARDKAFGRDE